MNFGKRILKAWTPENNTSTIPRASFVNPNQETRSSNYLLRNGSYFKLRNMPLGYTLPSTLAHKIKVGLLRAYVMGENFLLVRPVMKIDLQGRILKLRELLIRDR